MPNGNGSNDYKEQHKRPAHVHSLVDEDAGDDDYSVSGGGPIGSFQTQAYNGHAPMRPHYERQCARSILLSKLPDNTTHADITDAVRGGQLLDIYLRSNDRTAAVSFLLAADARAFYDHVKRHDLYINHKRVSGPGTNRFWCSCVTILRTVRLKFVGMIVNSSYPVMSPARLVSVPLAIL